ncbi:tannase/feruloyl esterase family alpha/beta hydrolase [Rhodococcus sp. NBC_00297]|uniref:tannase/feruloyl esterase family alpha/beta hydrolase n=1 Tax=Rhodococcus sp. NBC_00297 TaxID=2976005 RepID=UPI002E2A9D6E|nr:tannase/feruloyl esterase family alpha/beta hydrolase [Rhodococcus sp. NBC_00297]
MSTTHWVDVEHLARDPKVVDRCTPEGVAAGLAHLGGVEVVSVTVNTSGRFQPPPPNMVLSIPPPPELVGLPDYCDVRIRHTGLGGHVADIVVWLPLDWNGRFLGCAGGGNRTETSWYYPFAMPCRAISLERAVVNGFATATTDAGNRDSRSVAWGLDPATRELDWDLIENWVHRSTHEMTVIGKAVTEAIYGTPPQYSYFQGSSGGGRQAMMQAQRYPDDYDGIWSSDPAINWSRFIPAEIWPALVMKEENNPLAPAKLAAFRDAFLTAVNGPDGERYLTEVAVPDWDPHSLVGTETDAGVITETDAQVIRKIWDGPRRATGEQLWYGLRPGTESEGRLMGAALAYTEIIDGQLRPVPFSLAADYLGAWIAREPEWDWTTLTYQQFEEYFDRSVAEFAATDTDDPDLSGLRDAGGKVLLSQALADQVIFPEGTLQYYQRVLDTMGGQQHTNPYLQLYVSPGDGHSTISADGPGLTLAAGMAALMNWVEHDTVPASIVGERYDPSGNHLGSHPLLPYEAQREHP